MSEKLLPCPFCGHDTPEFERMGDRRQSCIVICGNCGARHESSDEGDRCGSSWNQRAEPSQDGLRVLEQAARMLRKYHRLCVELGRGDSYWLGEILATEAALRATPSAPTAVEPDERAEFARRYEWLRAQFWKDNTLGVVLRPADNTKLGCFLPFGKLLDDAIDHMSKAVPAQPEQATALRKSLLRPVSAKLTMCYCPPGVCQAPKPEWCINNRECDQNAARASKGTPL